MTKAEVAISYGIAAFFVALAIFMALQYMGVAGSS